jgi:S-formylglutathione hydrolase FrmB
VLVFLHGRGMKVTSFLDDAFFKGLSKLGDRAPIVAFPGGGDHSYWHDRDDGDWGRYVLREVIPQVLERTGADGDRVALGGISMGGFGAFDLATRAKRQLCAVGGHSPAIWRTAGETAPGAFDDAEDFNRHDIIARAGRLDGVKLWLDAGDEDPFLTGDRAFAKAAGVRLRTSAGGHNGDYWDRHWAQYLRFYARSCA